MLADIKYRKSQYRRVIFDTEVDTVLRDICLDIAQRYEIVFLEMGTDKDHVHFLVQAVPSYSPTKIVQIMKSLTAREIFHRVPTVKKRLWGGEFWSKGYFISTVGRQTWPKHQLHGCGNYWILLRGDALNLSAVQCGHFGAFHHVT